MLLATVTAVGDEPEDERIRVELRVDQASAPRIPLQHGLKGLAEVEVERPSPAGLVLRTAGRWLMGTGSAWRVSDQGREVP
jgi:hypothetical protein